MDLEPESFFLESVLYQIQVHQPTEEKTHSLLGPEAFGDSLVVFEQEPRVVAMYSMILCVLKTS